MDVHLTDSEMRVAALIGIERQTSALRDGKKDKHGAWADKAWTLHIEGAAGELAAARALGIYWPASVDTYRDEPDLPGGIEVRTRSVDHYDLIVRPDDDNDKRYVLVVGRPPELRVVGWITGGEAKQHPEWLKTYGNRPEVWFVPQSALNPIETLEVDR